jgi:hypothetical protein
LAQLRQSYGQKRTALGQALKLDQQTLIQRQQAGQATVRCQQGIARRQQLLQALTARYQKRRGALLTRLRQQRQQQCQLQAQLAEREACRDAIDTDTLCRERHLEKDQIMLNLQLLLTNLHDKRSTLWVGPPNIILRPNGRS